MTISKEERAELREQLSDEVPDNLWPDLPDHAIALLDALDAADERIAGLEKEAHHWRASAVGWAHWAASVTGEADQEIPDLTKFVAELKSRIAKLEARLAEESGDFYDCAHCGERKHKSNGGDPGVYCDECSLRMGLEHTIDVQKSRIAELEAAAQWRPMATAPRDLTCAESHAAKDLTRRTLPPYRGAVCDPCEEARLAEVWTERRCKMTITAWRPLKDAPFEGTILVRLTSGELARATAAVVHVGRDYDGSGGWPEAAWVNEDTGQVIRDDDLVGWLPIADTLELDRAVQSEIARAFGALIQAVNDAHACAFTASDPRLALKVNFKANLLFEADRLPRIALRKFGETIHTAMGGRIPDEVP